MGRGKLKLLKNLHAEIVCPLAELRRCSLMARRVQSVSEGQTEESEALVSALQAGCDLAPGDTIEDVINQLQKAIDRYLEALAAEERENRLSR